MTHRTFIPLYIIAIVLATTAIYLRTQVDTKSQKPVTWENPPKKEIVVTPTSTEEVVKPKIDPGSELVFTTASGSVVSTNKACTFKYSYPVLSINKDFPGIAKINQALKKSFESNPSFEKDCNDTFKNNPTASVEQNTDYDITINKAGLFGLRKAKILSETGAAHPSIEQSSFLFKSVDGSVIDPSAELDVKISVQGKTLNQLIFEKTNARLAEAGDVPMSYDMWKDSRPTETYKVSITPQGATFFDILQVQALAGLEVELTWAELVPYLKPTSKLLSFLKQS